MKGTENSQVAVPALGFRQSMTGLHTWAGLALGWVLYFIFLTGTAGYFDTEIDRWMQPELPAPQIDLPAADTVTVLLARLQREAPAAERWFITLPADRNTPYPQFFWQGASSSSSRLTVDATSGEAFTARDTGGGQLLYQMHWRLHYLPRSLSNPVVGFATLFMLVALITGVIIHKKIFRDFFTFRPGKGRRAWQDAHTALGVVALPFHLMITYSGLILLGFSLMPLVVAAYYGTDPKGRQQFIADAFDPPGLLEPAGVAAPLAPLGPMIATAERRWGEGRILFIDIRHPGDRNARVLFHENTDDSVSTGREQLVFDGASGALLHTQPPPPRRPRTPPPRAPATC
ncbi:PepSY-associated TM helix domain-containing protein [Microbulbifer taiwanensis]|uniref:PepSY-associated TM helix domain-containing protein n=1 Tax=Microbulbifer taiwanensis TaxID=986746 RepID=UPI003620F6F8